MDPASDLSSNPSSHTVHWREASMEAFGLGCFMLSAGVFGTLLESPASPVNQALASPFIRRSLMGAAMGLTAIAIIHSPWGKRSGAHINPAVTLTFVRLGRVRARDAVAYVVAQIAGAVAGVALVAACLGDRFLGAPVRAVVTLPGMLGQVVAFACELAMSFAMMTMVLSLGRSPRFGPHTGLFVGGLVWLYITFEAPLSGMSMNPARSFASALVARQWHALWIYFVAPPLGMLLAAECFARVAPRGCAKLVHALPCIFCGEQPHAHAHSE